MMSHTHDGGHDGAGPRDRSHPKGHSWTPHRDWRVWVAVGLIALVLGYVLMDSLALVPGRRVTQPVPEMGGR